jgi:hypothetical protein
MFDVRGDSVEFFRKDLISTLRSTDEFFQILFRTPLALKLNAGASVGDNWFNMKEI